MLLIIPLFLIFMTAYFMNDNLLITYCYKYFGLATEIGTNKLYILEAFLLVLKSLIMYIIAIFSLDPHTGKLYELLFLAGRTSYISYILSEVINQFCQLPEIILNLPH